MHQTGDAPVRLKCAGWVPHDDDSDVNVTAVYRRASPTISLQSSCAHRFSAGWFTHRVDAWSPASAKYLSPAVIMVASDQHQPASSRAIAALATTGRFLRLSKLPTGCAGAGWRRAREPAAPGRRLPSGAAGRAARCCRTCGDARPLRPAAVGHGVLPVLVTHPWTRAVPEEYSQGTKPEVGADRAPGQPRPVADLDRQPERGQRRRPRAGSPAASRPG